MSMSRSPSLASQVFWYSYESRQPDKTTEALNGFPQRVGEKHISTTLVIVTLLSCVWLSVTPRIVAYHIPPSMGFSRQEYWNGLPLPSPEDLPDPGIEPGSPAL